MQVDSSAQLAASAANLASSAAVASAAAAAAAAEQRANGGPSSSSADVLAANIAAAPSGGMAIDELPPPPTSAGRRGRQSNQPSYRADDLGDAPPPRPPSHSHKRGRGRKVSYKEAERQRQAAEAAAAAQTSPRLDPMITQHADYARQYNNPYGGHRGMPQPKETYTDGTLPLAAREDSNRPLTGAVPAPPEYVVPDRAKVCCRPTPQKGMPPPDWILGTVLRYNVQQQKYIVLDDDHDEQGNIISGTSQQIIPAKFCLPLPLFEPSAYTSFNEFPRGGPPPASPPRRYSPARPARPAPLALAARRRRWRKEVACGAGPVAGPAELS